MAWVVVDPGQAAEVESLTGAGNSYVGEAGFAKVDGRHPAVLGGVLSAAGHRDALGPLQRAEHFANGAGMGPAQHGIGVAAGEFNDGWPSVGFGGEGRAKTE
ncbi:hypothetical protein [Streptomyces sp. CA-179760]|uniref:hypothetical protein n=1 Tax=Streptomyces sp. CA-179760 TaxID=3240054 RepID=UPI003D8C74F8